MEKKDDIYICQSCNKPIPIANRVLHEVNCKLALKNSKVEICSICHNPITTNYLKHMSQFHNFTFEYVLHEGEANPLEEEKTAARASFPDEWVTSAPCEYCGQVLDFQDYVEHVKRHKIEEVTPGGPDDVPFKLADLPRVIYTGKGVDKACQICLLEYEPNEILVYLPCVHRFHEECITKWFDQQTTCPICKKEIFGKPSKSSGGGSSSWATAGEIAIKILIGLLIILGEVLA